MTTQPVGEPDDCGPPGSGEPRLDARVAETLETRYQQHAGAVYGYLRAAGLDRSSAMDVTHETFLKVGRYLRRGGVIESPPAYLNKAAYHAMVDWLRRPEQRHCPVWDVDITAVDESVESQFELVIERHDSGEHLAALRAALQELPARQREIVVMHYLSNISITNIARDLKISAGTVRYHLSRGRCRLEELVDPSSGRGEANHNE